MLTILWWIIVGLIAGWLTGKIMGGGGYGVVMDIVVGIVGAVIGGFIMRALGFAGSGSMVYTILVALFGAIILTLLIRLITKGPTRTLWRMHHGFGDYGNLSAPLLTQGEDQLGYRGDSVAVHRRGVKLPAFHRVQNGLVETVAQPVNQLFVEHLAQRADVHIDDDVLDWPSAEEIGRQYVATASRPGNAGVDVP